MTDEIPLNPESEQHDDHSPGRGWSDPERGDWLWSDTDNDTDTPGSDTGTSHPRGTTETSQRPSDVTGADHRHSNDSSDVGSGKGSSDTESTEIMEGSSASNTRSDADRPRPHVPHSHDRRTQESDPSGVKEKSGTQGQSSRVAPRSEQDLINTRDDMTMALTLSAVRRLDNPGGAVRDATEWTDWIGLVGDVSVGRLTRYCDETAIDPDFINATGTDPAERLSGIESGSMFHAERLVVVGTPDERSLATDVGWEFVPITEAASKAGWGLENP